MFDEENAEKNGFKTICLSIPENLHPKCDNPVIIYA
jgi:hypothetical protein